MPNETSPPPPWLAKADALEAAGKYAEVAAVCQGVLEADADDPAALHRLGRAMGRLGQLDLELVLLGQAIARAPSRAGFHSDLGFALLEAGHLADATESFDEALLLDPDCAAARTGQAGVAGRRALAQGQHREAALLLVTYLRDRPSDASALFYLGVALQSTNFNEAAAESYRQAIGWKPDFFEAHANLGVVLGALGETAAALAHAERAVALAPTRPGAYLNRANARRDAGDVAGAVADYRAALELNPSYAEAWSSLGNAYHDLGEWSHARDAHDHAVRLAPELAQARWNRSFTLLACGELAQGWDEYEWRHQTAAARPEPRAFPWPVWQGEPVGGKRILIWREQGLGDELLFLTCLTDLIQAGAEITLVASPRLVGLLRRAFPAVVVTPDGPDLGLEGRFDFQVPLGSLPRWLRRAEAAFPSQEAYLNADPVQERKWRARLAQLGPGPQVGWCWRSGLVSAERRRHYPALAAWAPLLTCPGVTWINLQYDDCEAELAEMEAAWGVKVHRWPVEDLKNDLESVAGLLAALDYVVTAPTAVSSLAGALGRPTWQVDSGSDWTVFGREESPWFPTIRVVARRPGEEDWVRVMEEVQGHLAL